MSFAALFLLPKPAAKKEGNESRPAGQTAPSPCEEECSVKRYYYKKEKVLLCARALFGQKEDYREDDYRKYQGMEVVVHPDGRFSVWGNLGERGRRPAAGYEARSCQCAASGYGLGR